MKKKRRSPGAKSPATPGLREREVDRQSVCEREADRQSVCEREADRQRV